MYGGIYFVYAKLLEFNFDVFQLPGDSPRPYQNFMALGSEISTYCTQSTVYSMSGPHLGSHCTPYTTQGTVHTVNNVQCVSVSGLLYTVDCKVNSAQCNSNSVQCRVDSLQYTFNIV